MPKSMTLFGDKDILAPGPATPEDAAEQYFVNRAFVGVWAPRPPVERWREDQRERYLAELDRLEKQNARQSADAVKQAVRRT